MITSTDVLERAYELVSTPPYPWSEHGEVCIYCAIATAKTELDREFGDSLTEEDWLAYAMTGQIFHKESDKPLEEARDIIQNLLAQVKNVQDNPKFCLSILSRALAEMK